MSIFTDIVGGIFSPIKDIVSEVVVDKDKRDQVNLELARLEDQAQARLDATVLAQIEVNKVEASSGSLFVAGWRPAVGWVGAAGFGYMTMLQPFLSFAFNRPTPDIDSTLIITIMTGMLGIGGMRSFEKVKGVSTNDLTNGAAKQASAPIAKEPDKKKGAASEQPAAPVKRKKFKIF